MTVTRRGFLKGLASAIAIAGAGCGGSYSCNSYGCDEPASEETFLEPAPQISPLSPIDQGLYQNQFNMAFVIVSDDPAQVTDKKIEYISGIADKFGESFSNATWGLSTMRTSFDVITLDSLLTGSKKKLDRDRAIKKFLETNSDDYDFITFFPFSQTEKENATPEFSYGIYPNQYHSTLQNRISGINISFKERPDLSKKLLGTNIAPILMSSEDYQLEGEKILSGLLHETGHQWGMYLGEDFNGVDNNLGVRQQGIHFYRGLHSPYSATTPMDSDHWVPNGDGTYHRVNEQELQSYHPIQLYCMGLLNEHNDYGGLLNRKFPIYDCGGADTGRPYNFQSATPHSQVSINDIIKVEGSRQWVENP